jgi:hypothetical protein
LDQSTFLGDFLVAVFGLPRHLVFGSTLECGMTNEFASLDPVWQTCNRQPAKSGTNRSRIRKPTVETGRKKLRFDIPTSNVLLSAANQPASCFR